MKSRLIELSVLSFLVAVGVVGVLAEPAKCAAGKDCSFTINEIGYGTSGASVGNCTWNGSGDNPCPYTEAFNTASSRATERLENGCTAAGCQANCGAGTATGLTNSGFGWQYEGNGNWAEMGAIPDAEGGGHWAKVYKHTTCNCTEEEYNLPMSDGVRAKVTPIQKLQGVLQQLKRKLFGNGPGSK